MRWRELNLAMWDERVPIHLASEFYDLTGFKRGHSSLQPFEADELGEVTGKELVHLQCHIALDTLSWARRGARVTGLDFSPRAVAAAGELARELGIAARFVCADVYDAASALGQQYDVVYTGIGALLWLPDIERWAAVVAALLRPGGTFYVVEVHPCVDVFSDTSLEVSHDYFHDPAGNVVEASGSYADASAHTQHNRSVEFRHPLGDVITALARQGLVIEHLREWPHTAYARWPFLERRTTVEYHMPPGKPRLPLLYSLRAVKR
jgi:SAM-dependent methyltransferase